MNIVIDEPPINERQRAVILGIIQGMTLAEIGAKLEVHRERIRQIKNEVGSIFRKYPREDVDAWEESLRSQAVDFKLLGKDLKRRRPKAKPKQRVHRPIQPKPSPDFYVVVPAGPDPLPPPSPSFIVGEFKISTRWLPAKDIEVATGWREKPKMCSRCHEKGLLLFRDPKGQYCKCQQCEYEFAADRLNPKDVKRKLYFC